MGQSLERFTLSFFGLRAAAPRVAAGIARHRQNVQLPCRSVLKSVQRVVPMSCFSVRSVFQIGFYLFCFVAVGSQAVAQSPATRTRQFAPGTLRSIEDVPSGRFRSNLDRLPPPAKARALDWLQRFHFTELDLDALNVDEEGGVFYVDDFSAGPTTTETEPTTSEAPVPVNPLPASLVFHSRPGAPNVLYLNFTGETVTGTAWNGSKTSIPAVAFSTDADFSTFSDSEQVAIKRVWQRVAEDYASFNIDVTTERPATFTAQTAHALITRNTDADGTGNPSSGAGGVAYVNVFGSGNYAYYRPGWVYYNNLANNESYIAEAVSHEIGHNMGLSHDAKTDGTSYYGGHGSGDTSWGPIMGTGYGQNVSQWSKGEYYLANNTQDDLALMAGKLTYRVDDYGNTRASASPLILTGGTNVISTTPETDPANTSSANKGVLASSSDVDVFSFVTGSGQVSLTVKPWIMPAGTRGGNLDVLLELYNAAGVLLLTDNPTSITQATIQTNLTEGQYFLYVRSTGVGDPMSSPPNGYTAYASLGQYFISGYVRPSGFVAPPQADLQVTDITQSGVAAKQFTVTYTDNMAVDVSSIDNSDVRVTGPNGYSRAAQLVSVDTPTDGTPRVATYSVTPPTGGSWISSHSGTYTVWLQTNQVADTENAWVAAGQLGQFNVSVPLVVYAEYFNSNPGWNMESQWQYGVPQDGANGPNSGFTSVNVLGYNLSGNYPNNLATVYAMSPSINCSTAGSLTLRFQRWLRVRNGDTATVQVSTNGSAWTTLWSASGNVADAGWQLMQYSLPSWTEGSPSVRLRWAMGSGSSQNDIGWNIDDIEITGSALPVTPGTNVTLIVSVNQSKWGRVSPTNGSYLSGSSAQVTATPSNYFRFSNWTGGASGTNNPVTVLMNSNKTLQAVFTEIFTTNHPTPLWWLATNGFTQNFETVVNSIGANGMPLWQSYVAGLNPNDANSQLRLSVATASGNKVVLHWNSVTGRVYTVWSSGNAGSGFSPVASAINLPSTITYFTNTLGASSSATFYRLQVQKP